MISMIAGWLVKRSLASGGALTIKHARRIAKIGLIAAAVVLAIVSLLVWDHFDDKAAIREHNAKRVEAALEAERRATAADAEREAARNAQSRETEDDLENIHAQDPDSEVRPASAGARRVAERLRND